jgi:hypothetical protein
MGLIGWFRPGWAALAVATRPWRSGADIQRLEQRLDLGLRGLRQQSDGLLTLFGTILNVLYARQTLTAGEFSSIIQTYTQMIRVGADAALERETELRNPLAREEAVRLQGYLDKAGRGEFFTSDQVEDYNRLVKRMEQDRPDDPGIWPLVALGAFLLGLFLASKSKE